MHYLYGDSSTSPFTSNFLEFLRDSIDFAVYVLEADGRLVQTRQRMAERLISAQAEIEEIETLGRAVATTVETTPKGAAESPAAACAVRMAAVCEETVRSAVAGVRARLADDIADADAEEEAEREGCLQALLGLLAPHVPPDSDTVLRLQLTENAGYAALLEGACAGIDLIWRQELEIPVGHAFEHALRVETLQRRLQVDAPDLTGWIKKQVTVRPQHLERLVISEVIQRGSKVELRLRSEPGTESGFDIECDLETGHVSASRLVAGQNQAAAGPFDVENEDAPKLVELCKAVRTHLTELTTTRAFEARVGDTEFQALKTFVPAIERFMSFLSPMVHEIAKHSLEPDELVLRRPLADNRREEIFVSKITLRDKYEELAPEHRNLFVPLGLRTSLSRSMAPIADVQIRETTRSELPPSNPPPPPGKPLPRIAPLPPPAPVFAPAGDPPSGRRSVAPDLESQAKAAPNVPIAAAPNAPAGPDRPSAPNAVAAPKVGAASRAAAPDPQAKKQQMLAALRKVLEKILELDSTGRQPDAHRECAVLLEGSGFASHGPEEQRRVLKLLLVLESRATTSDARLRALRAGRDRARGLAERLSDPADYELLGLCQLALDETAAAGESFRKGLALELDRSAESELCGRFRRHVAAL